MPPRKQPTYVFHFTHIDHLASVIRQGLFCDDLAQSSGLLSSEVGNIDIKERRRDRLVNVGCYGRVTQYVPFYFAPRSPMLFAIGQGKVPTYQKGIDKLVYLVTTLETLYNSGYQVVLTDRNAALRYAEYRVFVPTDLVDDGFVDWALMEEKYWANTPEDATRRERRMAEALVYNRVDWAAFHFVAVQNPSAASKISAILRENGVNLKVKVNPDWYF